MPNNFFNDDKRSIDGFDGWRRSKTAQFFISLCELFQEGCNDGRG